MIPQTIKPGTKVWHNDYGIGVFLEWTPAGLAVINFPAMGMTAISRRDLNEVE